LDKNVTRKQRFALFADDAFVSARRFFDGDKGPVFSGVQVFLERAHQIFFRAGSHKQYYPVFHFAAPMAWLRHSRRFSPKAILSRLTFPADANVFYASD
jgi:hypothetical protein